MAQRFLGDLLIGHREKRVERLQHDDVGAEPAPDAAELEADHAGADDAQAFRYVVEIQRARRVDNVLAVELRNRQLDRGRARREDDVLRLQRFDSGIGRHLDAIAREQLAAAFDAGDPAGLEHGLDTRRELLDDAALAKLHGFDVDAEPRDVNAVGLKLRVRAVIELGGFEQRFRRNAPDVQAGTAEEALAFLVLPVVDARDRETELRGP